MRATAGDAEDREAVEAQVVGECAHVGRRVGHDPAWARIGETVSRTVVGDEADALVHPRVGVTVEPAPGRSVVEDDRPPVGVAALDVREPSAVRCLERPLPLHASIIGTTR